MAARAGRTERSGAVRDAKASSGFALDGRRRGRQKTMRRGIKCVSNMRQIGLAVIGYSGDNGDRLPINTNVLWPWGLDIPVHNELLRQGMPREVVYCPGAQNHNNERDWNWSVGYHLTG